VRVTVSGVHPDDELMDAAAVLAGKLAAGPALALGRTRRLMRQAFGTSLPQQLDAEASSIASMGVSEDARRLIAAFASRSFRVRPSLGRPGLSGIRRSGQVRVGPHRPRASTVPDLRRPVRGASLVDRKAGCARPREHMTAHRTTR